MSILTISNITKDYGKIRAVDGLSLSIEKGNVYGILGPNGSGKTTTLGMVLGIIRPTSGSYEWFGGGEAEHDSRKRIGTLLETPNFYPYMNALQNLEIVAKIKGVKNPPYQHLLELVNLYERRLSSFKTYSLGMKQRLAIAAAMVGDPEVLIFDEPTNGLDPQGIAEVRNTIRAIAEQGKTIIMASHILDEVEKICSHVAIIRKGKLLAMGTVGAIINNDKTIEVGANDLRRLNEILANFPKIKAIKVNPDRLSLSVTEDCTTAELNALLFEKQLILTHLVEKKKSLEAEFLEIIAQA
jgi:ABC-2 type transport system ATP-binding protein